jgi:membrane protease subunit HflK
MSKEETKSDLHRVFRTAKVVGIGLGILLVLLYFASGFYSIKPEQRGVVKRFGRVLDDNVLPGIHWHWPWPVETVLRPAATEVRSMNIAFGIQLAGATVPDTDKEKIETDSLMTGDENLVLVSVLIQYMVDRPASYLFNTKNGVEWLLSRVARAACVKSAAEMTVDDLLVTGKFVFQNNVKEAVQAMTIGFDLGIRIASIQIQSVQPPTAVAAAFRDVSSAREDKQRLVEQAEGDRNREIPERRSMADQTIKGAEAYAMEVVSRAEGETQRFLAAWEEYRKSKNNTARRLYLETMEKILPKVQKIVSNPQAEKLMRGTGATRDSLMQLPISP